MASPTRPQRSADRVAPGPGGARRRRLREMPGPYEVSLDHLVNIVATACRNHLLRPLCLGRSDGGCRPSPGAPEEQGPWLPRASAGRHLNRPFTGSLSFKPAALLPPPPQPRVTPTHWASAIELQRPKLKEDFHLLAGEAAWRTTRLRGAEAPLKPTAEDALQSSLFAEKGSASGMHRVGPAPDRRHRGCLDGYHQVVQRAA